MAQPQAKLESPGPVNVYQEATNMIAVDLETKMVLSVPGPDKGPSMLRRAAEELTRFTVSLHNEDAVVIQSDGEPSTQTPGRIQKVDPPFACPK